MAIIPYHATGRRAPALNVGQARWPQLWTGLYCAYAPMLGLETPSKTSKTERTDYGPQGLHATQEGATINGLTQGEYDGFHYEYSQWSSDHPAIVQHWSNTAYPIPKSWTIINFTAVTGTNSGTALAPNSYLGGSRDSLGCIWGGNSDDGNHPARLGNNSNSGIVGSCGVHRNNGLVLTGAVFGEDGTSEDQLQSSVTYGNADPTNNNLSWCLTVYSVKASSWQIIGGKTWNRWGHSGTTLGDTYTFPVTTASLSFDPTTSDRDTRMTPWSWARDPTGYTWSGESSGYRGLLMMYDYAWDEQQVATFVDRFDRDMQYLPFTRKGPKVFIPFAAAASSTGVKAIRRTTNRGPMYGS